MVLGSFAEVPLFPLVEEKPDCIVETAKLSEHAVCRVEEEVKMCGVTFTGSLPLEGG